MDFEKNWFIYHEVHETKMWNMERKFRESEITGFDLGLYRAGLREFTQPAHT